MEDPGEVSAQDKRCKKNKRRCSKESGHEGRCDNKTPVNSFWEKSPLTFQRKINRLTEQKSEAETQRDDLVTEIKELGVEKDTKTRELDEVKEQFKILRLMLDQKESARKRRQNTATTLELISDYNSSKRYRRRKETSDLLEYIHGGTEGAIYGAWDFIKSVANVDIIETLVMTYKRGKFLESLYGKFSKRDDGDKAMKKAIATKYLNLLSRRKYALMCKIQKRSYDPDSQGWHDDTKISYGDITLAKQMRVVSHNSMEKFVKDIDIGPVHQIPGYTGITRTVTALVNMVADLHLRAPSLKDQLIWFNNNSNHFVVEFSDDGAPETREATMTIGTLSLWNLGNRIRSRESHYLLHTLTAKEKEAVCEDLWRQHTEEMQLIENNVFTINNENITFEFQPSADQAWQYWAANVLTQSASYPSLYANVHKSQLQLTNGSIGAHVSNSTWQVPTMEQRHQEVKELNEYRKTLRTDISPENKHKQELSFMAEKGYRQLGETRIGIFADKLRPEPLHLEINNWQHVLDLIYKEAVRRGKFKDFINVLKSPRQDTDVPGCGLKFAASLIEEHYNVEKKRMNKLDVRLIGSQAIALAQFSYCLIDILEIQHASDNQILKQLALSKICQSLRDIGAMMNRVNVNSNYPKELKGLCQLYFNLFALFYPDNCQSTVWTLGYALPYHAEQIHNQYGVGYGVLSMQGKESKHSALKQELKSNSNRSNAEDETGKWNQIMRNNFIRNFYLPFHFPLTMGSYHSHYHSRLPPLTEGFHYCNCSRVLKSNRNEICKLCKQCEEILASAEKGELCKNILDIMKPVKCKECNERFADFLMCDKHVTNVHVEKLAGTKKINPQTMSVADLKYHLKIRNHSTSGSKEILKRRLTGILSAE